MYLTRLLTSPHSTFFLRGENGNPSDNSFSEESQKGWEPDGLPSWHNIDIPWSQTWLKQQQQQRRQQQQQRQVEEQTKFVRNESTWCVFALWYMSKRSVTTSLPNSERHSAMHYWQKKFKNGKNYLKINLNINILSKLQMHYPFLQLANPTGNFIVQTMMQEDQVLKNCYSCRLQCGNKLIRNISSKWSEQPQSCNRFLLWYQWDSLYTYMKLFSMPCEI